MFLFPHVTRSSLSARTDKTLLTSLQLLSHIPQLCSTSLNHTWRTLEYRTLPHTAPVSGLGRHTFSFSLPHLDPLSSSHINTHTVTEPESLLSVQLWAVFPSPWPFPAQTMLCVPQRKLSSRLQGSVWPSAAPPQISERPPEPPHHNLLRCQVEHLCDSGEETLKFSH